MVARFDADTVPMAHRGGAMSCSDCSARPLYGLVGTFWYVGFQWRLTDGGRNDSKSPALRFATSREQTGCGLADTELRGYSLAAWLCQTRREDALYLLPLRLSETCVSCAGCPKIRSGGRSTDSQDPKVPAQPTTVLWWLYATSGSYLVAGFADSLYKDVATAEKAYGAAYELLRRMRLVGDSAPQTYIADTPEESAAFLRRFRPGRLDRAVGWCMGTWGVGILGRAAVTSRRQVSPKARFFGLVRLAAALACLAVVGVGGIMARRVVVSSAPASSGPVSAERDRLAEAWAIRSMRAISLRDVASQIAALPFVKNGERLTHIALRVRPDGRSGTAGRAELLVRFGKEQRVLPVHARWRGIGERDCVAARMPMTEKTSGLPNLLDSQSLRTQLQALARGFGASRPISVKEVEAQTGENGRSGRVSDTSADRLSEELRANRAGRVHIVLDGIPGFRLSSLCAALDDIPGCCLLSLQTDTRVIRVEAEVVVAREEGGRGIGQGNAET